MTQSFSQIAQKAQAQLESIMPGKVTVQLEISPSGQKELVGYYEQRNAKYMHSQELMGDRIGCLDLFFSYFNNRKEYIMASPEMQQRAFDKGIHPQAYPMFADELAQWSC